MDTNNGEQHLQGQSDNVAAQFFQTLVSTCKLLGVTQIKICQFPSQVAEVQSIHMQSLQI
jgi:hypothetical protein